MSSEDFVSKYLDITNRLYSIGMKQIKLTKKLLGTNFIVERPKDSSKYKQVFGGAYSSDDTLELDYDRFEVRLVVNMNEMKEVWARNRDSIEVYNDIDELEYGDELQYTRDGRTYRFKVTNKLAFSEVAEAMFVYTLTSIIETKEE